MTATKIATIELLSHIRPINAQKFFGATAMVELPCEILIKLGSCFASYSADFLFYMVYHTPKIASAIVKLSSYKLLDEICVRCKVYQIKREITQRLRQQRQEIEGGGIDGS
jgi:hypothetical protein